MDDIKTEVINYLDMHTDVNNKQIEVVSLDIGGILYDRGKKKQSIGGMPDG
ncbi:MAG: hypothetical protein JRF58_07935 [Deltaproteobacteria bacterium]|nr:hypothetical protein [Deltaproteobacteria bacterium]